MFFRFKIFLLLIPILFGVKLLSITIEEFLSGISIEDLTGPIVGNKYFHFEVPDEFSLVEENSTIDELSWELEYKSSSTNENLTIRISRNSLPAEMDPLEHYYFKETGSGDPIAQENYPESENITTANGFKGKTWAGHPRSPREHLVLLISNKFETSYGATSQIPWYAFYRSSLPIDKVTELANKFKLKDGSGSSGAEQPNNPVITVKNARKIGETFVLNSLNSNWFESDWLGTFWEKQDSSWIYHTFMGWVYTGSIKSNPENLWLHKQGLGWLWTSEESYPWLYSDKTKFWVYLNLNEDIKPKQYFDSFDDRFWPWNSFPDRSYAEIESKNIQKILTDTDKDSKSKADAIMSAIMQGL